jgi:hypothetical protein
MHLKGLRKKGFILPLVLAFLGLIAILTAGMVSWVAVNVRLLKQDLAQLQMAVFETTVVHSSFKAYEALQKESPAFWSDATEESDVPVYQAWRFDRETHKSLGRLDPKCLKVAEHKVEAQWQPKVFPDKGKDPFLKPLSGRKNLANLLDETPMNGTIWDHQRYGPLWAVAKNFCQFPTTSLQGYGASGDFPDMSNLWLWMNTAPHKPMHGYTNGRGDPKQSAVGPVLESLEWYVRIEERHDEHLRYRYHLELQPVVTLYNPHAFPLGMAKYQLSFKPYDLSPYFVELDILQSQSPKGLQSLSLGKLLEEFQYDFSKNFKFNPGERQYWELGKFSEKIGPEMAMGDKFFVNFTAIPLSLWEVDLHFDAGEGPLQIELYPEIESPFFGRAEYLGTAGDAVRSEKGDAVFIDKKLSFKWQRPLPLPLSLLQPFQGKEALQTPLGLKDMRPHPHAPFGDLGYSPKAQALDHKERQWLWDLNGALWDGTYSSLNDAFFEKKVGEPFAKGAFWMNTRRVDHWESFIKSLGLGIDEPSIKKWAAAWVDALNSGGPFDGVRSIFHRNEQFLSNAIWEEDTLKGINPEAFLKEAWLRLDLFPSRWELTLKRDEKASRQWIVGREEQKIVNEGLLLTN